MSPPRLQPESRAGGGRPAGIRLQCPGPPRPRYPEAAAAAARPGPARPKGRSGPKAGEQGPFQVYYILQVFFQAGPGPGPGVDDMSQACLPVRCHCSVNFSALRPRIPTVLASVARGVLQLNLRFRYYPGGSDARRGRSRCEPRPDGAARVRGCAPSQTFSRL